MRRSWATGIVLVGAVTGYSNIAAADDTATRSPDPKQACVDAAEQGQTLRDEGNYRAARDSFLACARDACPKVVVQSCSKWLRELDESAPTIVPAAKDEQGNDVTNVNVTLDGQPFATVLDGKPVVADAGQHTLRFEREGSVPVEQTLVLRAGERARVVTVTLRPINEPPPMPPPPDHPPVTPPLPQETHEPLMSPRHVVAGSIGLGALVAAGAGVVFVLLSNSAKNSASDKRAAIGSNSACAGASTPAQCASLDDDVNSQYRDMNIATGLFVGAGALAAGAVGAWFLWPKAQAAPPQTTGWIMPIPGGAALQVGGSFR